MAESTKNARQKAAQARAEQLAAEKRRERMIRIIGAVVVVLVVGAIIGGALYFSNKDSGGDGPNPSAALPTGVQSSTYGYPVNPTEAAGVPNVQIWEDFQCPGCAQYEKSSAAAIDAEAKAGRMNVLLRPATFLDDNFGNDASAQATSAWGCAINAGKSLEYHSAVFAMQPQQEGVGFTQQQLLDAGKQVGITGDALTTFDSCVKAETFLGWASNSQAEFGKSDAKGTPAIFVNGKELENKALPDKTGLYTNPTELIKAINAAAK